MDIISTIMALRYMLRWWNTFVVCSSESMLTCETFELRTFLLWCDTHLPSWITSKSSLPCIRVAHIRCVCAGTHSDTSETGKRNMFLSASISRSSAKLLLRWNGGCVCTSKNSDLCFTTNAHTFTHTQTEVLWAIMNVNGCKWTRNLCVQYIHHIFQ